LASEDGRGVGEHPAEAHVPREGLFRRPFAIRRQRSKPGTPATTRASTAPPQLRPAVE